MNLVVIRTALIACLCIILLTSPGFAQPDGIWRDVSESAVAPVGERLIVPLQYRTLELNVQELSLLLSSAPMEGTPRARTEQLVVRLPLPDGESGRFHVVESPIMAPELAARYPEIRTYMGQGLDDRTATVRFDVTPAGFHAMILSNGPTVYIDPYSRGNTRHYISYFKGHLLPDPARTFEEIDVVDEGSMMANEIAQIIASGMMPSSIGEQLRTYRLALATTGEYTQFHGGTVAQGMAAVVTAMNRVNGIYEREVAVRMVLIANNDTLIYTNPATDPYTNNSGGTMLGQNQSNLDNVIGNANYDIGHVFSTGGGGVAGLGVVCRTGVKARGVTGLPSPIGDPFYVDYVAHEMGHQFGANHTFNGNAGSCSGGNRNASTAYEPGSGSTIMAYAGICGAQNIQNLSDDYFHGISIDEIVAYTTVGSGNGCPVVTNTGNNAPIVNAGPTGFAIPINTPFLLTGSATDLDNDTLTYCWEQFDLGPAGAPNSPSGNAPIFRSFRGTASSSRIFPRLSDLVNNTQTIGEILPGYGRTLNFRLTARDNRSGGGGVGKASMSMTVVGTAGPFQVTSPNTAIAWVNNTTDTVRWSVANTNLSPINCSNVNILLSTDGGQTFPIVLASNTPNDGMEPVSVPAIITSNARVKVEAVGNVFFDISNVNFTIAPLAAPALVSPQNNTIDQPRTLPLVWRPVAGATTYHVQVSLNTAFSTTVVNDSTLTDTSRTVSGLNASTNYYWRVRGKGPDGTGAWSATWTFRTVPNAPVAPSLVAPANGSAGQSPSPLLRWSFVLFATSYHPQVSGDSTFAAVLFEDSLTTNERTVPLAMGERYFWRVRSRNAGGFSNYSAVWSFTTAQLPGQVALVAPAHAAIISSDTATFTWMRTGPEDAKYWFELADDSLFTSSAIDSTLTDTVRVRGGLVDTQTYWWRVRAGNAAGWGAFSENRKFTVMTTSVYAGRILPTEYALAQNYPNPFNPTTVVSFDLPHASFVVLKVYNVLGQEMMTLVNDVLEAGRHQAVLDARQLPSGVYVYQMQAGTFTATRKMVIMR